MRARSISFLAVLLAAALAAGPLQAKQGEGHGRDKHEQSNDEHGKGKDKDKGGKKGDSGKGGGNSGKGKSG